MWRRRATGTAPPSGVEPPGESEEDDLTAVFRAMLDRRAFAPLYQKYLTPILRYCAGHLRDEEEAWDAANSTFQKALAALDGFQGGSFEGWLYRIATNTCNDVHRARQPHSSLDDEHDQPLLGPDPEEQAIATMNQAELDQALRQLTPRRERIVRLHLAGLKGKEIAARLGISHDLVRKEQERALDHLARLLGVDQEEGGAR